MKQVLGGAVAMMLIVALAAIAWRLQMSPEDAGKLRPRPLGPLILLSIPAIFAVLLAISARKLDARDPEISQDNTRHVQGAMVFSFLGMVACQAWIAFMYVGGEMPGGDTPVRGAVVLVGVAMAVRGNFVGKLSPPAGAGSICLAVWARAARRMGLSLVLLGTLLTVGALALPLRPLFAMLMASAVVVVVISIAHHAAIKLALRTQG
ncbi:hypothetical protein [Phenylobacterium sp.]|uniref:hypothetical protein n=1 Tax=Phenylobacterium sp. TaxID=1871053 RepID=UPI0030F47D63